MLHFYILTFPFKRLFLEFLELYVFIVYEDVFVWVYAPATACVEVREHPWELVLSFHHVVPELVIRLGGNCCYQLSDHDDSS